MVRRRLLLFSAIVTAQMFSRAIGQSPSNSPFQVRYAPSGIASLQKVQDNYATDYIQSGYTLGDIRIRYRAEGTNPWNEISAASRDTAAQANAATYTINRLQPTLAGSATVSASLRGPGVRVLNAALEPSNSHDIGAPRFTWAGKTGTSEWPPSPARSRSLSGLPAGSYRLTVGGVPQPAQAPVDGALNLQVPISGGQVAVELMRAGK